MLNVVDLLGDLIDRSWSFTAGHWIFLVVVVCALVVRKSRVAPTLMSVPGTDISATPGTDKSVCATVTEKTVSATPGSVAPTLLSVPGRQDFLSSTTSIAIIVITSLAVSLGYTWLHGTPIPQYHDDFAYLLDADTFAHGRMSNPTHPLWPHFETMHVLQMPRYISKYPIGQGLIFAAGSVIFGHPLRAVWLLGAMTCVAVWWALRAFTTPLFALLGGVAMAIHPTMVEWMESYHGGALAALGGALLAGAAARNRTFGAVAAAGAVLLAISRPYEGLVFCAAVGIVLIRRVSIAGVAVAIVALALLGFHNRSITGSAFVLPYSVYEQQYDPAPNFLWEKARPMPRYRNAEMEFVYRVTYLGQYKRVHTPDGLLDETLKKIDVIDRAVFGPGSLPNPRPLFLLLAIPAIPLLRADEKSRHLALLLLLFAFAPFSIIWWLQLHYLSPATVVVAGMAMLLVRRMFAFSPILAIAILVLFVANSIASFDIGLSDGKMQENRIAIAHALLSHGGRHLIVVAPDVFDAVYNGADLNGAPIVWARDLGPQSNAQLIAYYRDRTIWRLTPGGLRRY